MFSIFQLFFQKYLWKIRNISTDVGVVVWNILKWVIFKLKDLPWQSWFLIIWIGERDKKTLCLKADTAFFYCIEVWCIVVESGEGLGAVLVVAGLSLFAEPDENEDPAYQRDEDEEVEGTWLANVVQATPCNCQRGNEQSKRYEPAQEGNPAKHDAHDEVEEEEVPVFRTGCATVEISVLGETGLHCGHEVHTGGNCLLGLRGEIALIWIFH